MSEELTEFWLSIEYHTIQNPERISIIARNVEDAKQIATELFKQHHAEACVIDRVSEIRTDLPQPL